MRIEYTPPTYNLDLVGINDYFKRYVEPLGRGRTTVRVVNDEFLLESDRPGFLVLAVRLLDIAFGRQSSYMMEPMQEWKTGKWYLDMEPGTPEFSIMRHGPPLKLLEKFVYEAPPYTLSGPGIDPISKLAVGVGGLDGDHVFCMKADANSLVSLAKRSIYLSQVEVPIGESTTYKPNFEIDPRVSQLRLVLAEFSQDVPWAKSPNQRGTSNDHQP